MYVVGVKILMMDVTTISVTDDVKENLLRVASELQLKTRP